MSFSDSELELLDGMVGMSLTRASSAASSSEIGDALDVGDLDHFIRCLKKLIDEDLVRRRHPESISEKMGYYVNLPMFKKLLAKLDPEGELAPMESPDWEAVKSGVQELNEIVEDSNLSQSERAQAGAILASISILLEAPEPPARSIKALLHDLAAVATVLALAMTIAGMIF